jgi:hypothetical protein
VLHVELLIPICCCLLTGRSRATLWAFLRSYTQPNMLHVERCRVCFCLCTVLSSATDLKALNVLHVKLLAPIRCWCLTKKSSSVNCRMLIESDRDFIIAALTCSMLSVAVSAFASVHVMPNSTHLQALNLLHAELLNVHSLLFVDRERSSSVNCRLLIESYRSNRHLISAIML